MCPSMDLYWSSFEILNEHASMKKKIGKEWEKDLHKTFSKHNIKGKEIFRSIFPFLDFMIDSKTKLPLQQVIDRIKLKGQELADKYGISLRDGYHPIKTRFTFCRSMSRKISETIEEEKER